MPEQSEELRDLVAQITTRFNHADQGVHQRFRDRANHFWGLYRGYSDWKAGLSPRDRDPGLAAAKRDWGAELFIPYAFSTVETILPRMLSNSPKILVRPRGRASEKNVENIRFIIEAQQEQIDYELILQNIARIALITGLGVQKVYWKRDERTQKQVRPRKVRMPGLSDFVVDEVRQLAFDDPMVECVDPFDFFWDPMAARIADCEWAIHRTWRSHAYCTSLLKRGIWKGIEESDITEGGTGNGTFTDAFQTRLTIQGYPNFQARDTHEVWEYHNGREVITVLDRQYIVQQGANPAWHGELPFQVYRPTPVPGHMVGIGEIEPIEDLQSEINTLRSQRRDNATLVLQKSFFYADGSIDPADFKIGPGRGIPTFGPPSDSISPINFGDIPNSGYQEERQLQADIERTTGIDDSLSGSGQPQQTATGVQLVQAAANLRIQQKTRNAEIELVRAGGRQFLALDQQRILSNREIRIPAEPTPGEPDRRWAWLEVGPEQLKGEFEIDVEGGSMAPENTPQQRADAAAMQNLMGNPQLGPFINPDMGIRYILRNMGLKGEDAYLQAPEQKLPAGLVDQFKKALVGAKVDQRLIDQAWAASMPKEEGQ